MATLISPYNVHLLTSVDIVPLMKTAGVVKKFCALYIFYWIKVFLKLPFAVSFSVLFFTIQYAVFRKSFRTFYVSLSIYIYDYYSGYWYWV